MNRLIVPIILTAVMVIGISFIMMPIQRAQTVHLTIQNAQLNEAGALSSAQLSTALNGDSITVTSTEDFVVSCIIINDTGADVPSGITITIGSVSASFDSVRKEPALVHYAVNKGDTLTVSSTATINGLCTAMTTTAGTIIFG